MPEIQDALNARILIVEDDHDINTLLKKILLKAGFSTVQAYSGTEAQLCIKTEQFDLILLDLMLPGITGEEFISFVRDEKHLTTPIIVLSAKATVSGKVSVLKAGADDYLTKPFATEEVLARVDVVLRRTNAHATASPLHSSVYEHRDLKLNCDSRRAWLKEEELILTAHEFDLLETLIKNPDTAFSKERLYKMIWGGGYYGEDNTITVHVSNIRKKMAAISDEEYIQTIWGIGFKLV